MASNHETAVAALQTVLSSIVGGAGGYVYTPQRVQRVTAFDDHWFDASLTSPATTYLIRPGAERRRITVQGCYVDVELEIFVMVAQRFEEAGEIPDASNPTPTPLRWQRIADVVGDVLAKINADTTLGVGVPTGAGPVVDVFSTDVNYALFAQTWTVAEIRLVIRYRYLRQGER